jgi:UDP-N-acetylmuramyl pentapeptide phosphotransferase/UDP-N-acetylglucosamine-1-phosphate transferase
MEAVCANIFGGILLFRGGLPSYSQLSWLLAAASLGFLLWNWPPAKIFMGDVGSGFLGFTLGTLALFSSNSSPGLIWPWLILLAAFFVDATVTLLRRMLPKPGPVIRRLRWRSPQSISDGCFRWHGPRPGFRKPHPRLPPLLSCHLCT